MRFIANLLLGIVLPNVYSKYLLVKIDGDQPQETELETTTLNSNGPEQSFATEVQKDDDTPSVPKIGNISKDRVPPMADDKDQKIRPSQDYSKGNIVIVFKLCELS